MEKKRTSRSLKACLILGLCLTFCDPQESAPEDEELVLLQTHLGFLASDNLAGRLIGSPGCQKAEEYISQCFRQHGLYLLKGMADYSWHFQLKSIGFDRQTSFFKIDCEVSEIEFQYGLDFIPLRLGSVGAAEGELVFVGYGLKDDSYGYDDYEGLEVKDKIVLALRGEPRFIHSNSDCLPVYHSFSQLYKKVELAAKLKAKAIVFISPPSLLATDDDALLEEKIYFLYGSKPDANLSLCWGSIPAVFATRDLAQALFGLLPASAESIEQALENRQKALSFKTTPTKVKLSCQKSSTPDLIACHNIVGLLPALNPAIPGRYILICAHHDHLGQGIGTGDTIFNGADDNASGVATLLYLMQFLSRQRLRHSFLFVTFSAEECGLFGSQAFAFKAEPDLKQIRYVINLDMLGRNPQNELSVLSKTTKLSKLSKIFEFLSKEDVAIIKEEPPFTMTTDDYWFAQLGVDTFYFSSRPHADYHTVNDEAERIAYHTLAKRARIIKDFLIFLDSL